MSRVGRWGRAAVAVAGLAVLVAWDTKLTSNGAGNNWFSMYFGPADVFYTLAFDDPSQLTGNEHAEISHAAHVRLGWTPLYALGDLEVVDLNASLWHPEVKDVPAPSGASDGDVAVTPLVERRLPHPARWSGVPDFSYSPTDWMNRNAFCPALPPDAPEYAQCHAFEVWLAAVLNSSHFGDQATAMYRHYHTIALGRAAAARELGASVEAAVAAGSADVEEMEAYVREAELEALAFEGTAQHFLADRWSSGHGWNRWNGPSYEALDDPDALVQMQAIGALSGVIHGAEAVIGDVLPDLAAPLAPDPMCSPLILDDVAVTTQSVLADGQLDPGVGDYRFSDLLEGRFGDDYGLDDVPLPVSTQESSMMRCAMAGWADVARGFHPRSDGTFGALRLAVTSDTPTFDAGVAVASGGGTATPCFEHWATNLSFDTGLTTLGQSSLGAVVSATAQLGAVVVGVGSGGTADFVTGDFARLVLAVKSSSISNPNGTDLARGASLPSLFGVDPGQSYVEYAPPDYAEPASFDDLPFRTDPGVPDEDGLYRPGRDQRTVWGFFNRAHAVELCERSEDDLTPDPSLPFGDPEYGLRWPVPLPEDADADLLAARLDACVYLADRLYESTRRWDVNAPYLGPQAETRRASNAAGACRVFDAVPSSAEVGSWRDNPRHLHPTYVDALRGPFAQVEVGSLSFPGSLDAWCRAIPIVHVDNDDFVAKAGGGRLIVRPGRDADGRRSFLPQDIDPNVILSGLHFGSVPGRVKLVGESGCIDPLITSEFADIVSWSDTEIKFTLHHTRFPPDVYNVEIIRDDRTPAGSRVRSEGRIRLDVRETVFTGIDEIPPPLNEGVFGQNAAALHPWCTGGEVVDHTIHDCTDVIGGAEHLCGLPDSPVGDLMWQGPAIVPFQPHPYPGHEWGVVQSGTCEGLPTPSGCPPGLPLEYGLVWRMEHDPEQPTTAPPRRWRFTLVWQRVVDL